MTAGPRLTVVVASRTGLAESRPILEHLTHQSLASALEVIVVATRGMFQAAELEGFRGFESIRLVEVDRVESRGEAAAHGLRQARAPFAGPCENHSFPEPDALERLIIDREPADGAVSASLRSANPETLRSLAMYLLTYGHASAPALPGPRDSLPHHNAVWQTSLLRDLGDRLPDLMREENRLHDEARHRGFQLRVCPQAVNWHINEARWGRAVADPFVLGMRFGAARARGWSLARRVAYGLAVPAIAALRLRGLMAMAGRALDTRDRRARLVPMLLLTATTTSLGEAWGYLFPRTPVPAQVEEHEFHIRGRLAGVTPRTPWLRDLVGRLSPGVA